MRFVFYFQSDDDALTHYGSSPAGEVARMLEHVAKDVRAGFRGNAVTDINGNKIGRWLVADKHQTWRCAACKSSESVMQLAWVSPNTEVKVEEFALEGGTRDDFWCQACSDHTDQEQDAPAGELEGGAK